LESDAFLVFGFSFSLGCTCDQVLLVWDVFLERDLSLGSISPTLALLFYSCPSHEKQVVPPFSMVRSRILGFSFSYCLHCFPGKPFLKLPSPPEVFLPPLHWASFPPVFFSGTVNVTLFFLLLTQPRNSCDESVFPLSLLRGYFNRCLHPVSPPLGPYRAILLPIFLFFSVG